MSLTETPRDLDSGLLMHARIGLQRIHARQYQEIEPPIKNEYPTKKNDKTSKTTTPVDSPKQPAVEKPKKQYINLKKIPKTSVYYQHGRQGMKYWYEENKPIKYETKIPMGRKGTLLGLVDAPYK